MKNLYIVFKNKLFLKSLLAIIIFLISVSAVSLLKYSKNNTPIIKKHSKSEIRKILNKADILYDSFQLHSSYYYFNKAQLLCDTNTDYIDYVYALTCMASIEQMQGDFVASEITLTKTLPYLKKIKKPRFSANVYNQFASNYYYTYDYNNSLAYHIKSLHLKTSTYRKIGVLNSICQIYLKQKKFKLAQSILISLSKIKTICEDKKANDNEYSRILDDLGICYYEQGRPEALEYYKKSLAIRIKLQDHYSLLYTNLHIAEYFQIHNPKLAQSYAKNAYINSVKLHDGPNKLQSLKFLVKTAQGKDLKRYSLKFIQVADSITKARKMAKDQFSRIKYYSNIDKAENLQLKAQKAEYELQLERQKNRKIVSYIIIVFTLALILFLIFYLSFKTKKDKNEAIYRSEMRISKKLHDELANDIYRTITFATDIDLEIEENRENFLINLDTIYTKTRNISLENSVIKTNENYSVILKEMISGFNTEDLNILLNGFDSIQWNQIDKNKKIILYRVLHELLTNMKKDSSASLVGINFKTENKNILVNYTDNGNGEDLNTIHSKTQLQNIQSRILNIKGNIDFDSSPYKGFKALIKLPL